MDIGVDEEIIEVENGIVPLAEGTTAANELATSIIGNANEVAIRTIGRARRELAGKLRSAKSRAMRLGHKRAVKSAHREIEELKVQLAKDFRDKLSIFKDECLELTLLIAQEVVADELATNPQSIKRRITRAVQQLSKTTRYKAFFNPKDLSTFKDLPQPIITAESDHTVTRGAARLESLNGTVNIDPLKHLSRIAAEIRNSLLGAENP